MPTPGGRLRRGDRIEHAQSGQRFTVITREGTTAYSVILRPDSPLRPGATPAYGYPGCIRLTEADWWLENGRYRVVEQ